MKTENRTPLTLLEACTLMARETVSLLDGTSDTLKSATTFRNALATLNPELPVPLYRPPFR